MRRRRPTLLIALPLVLAAGLLALFAVATTAPTERTVLPSVLIGQPAPPAHLPPPPGHGQGLDTGALAGQVTLVNFFASWCGPCLREHPLLTELGRRDTLTIVGIASGDAPEDAAAWLTRHGNPFAAVGLDPDNRLGLDWGVYGVPESFILDRRGIIRYRHVGEITRDVLQDTMLPLIEGLNS